MFHEPGARNKGKKAIYLVSSKKIYQTDRVIVPM